MAAPLTWTGYLWSAEHGWQQVAAGASRREVGQQLAEQARAAGVVKQSHQVVTLGKEPSWSPAARAAAAAEPVEQPVEAPGEPAHVEHVETEDQGGAVEHVEAEPTTDPTTEAVPATDPEPVAQAHPAEQPDISPVDANEADPPTDAS